MKNMVIIATTLIAFGLATSDAAAKGIYLGAGLGNTFYSTGVEDALDEIQEIDENSTAWKIFAGFHGTKFFGIEGGYRSFGEISSTISDEVFKSETTGWDVEAMGRFEIAVVDIFGKAGVMFWSTDVRLLGEGYDETGTDFFWGVGAGVRVGPVGARLEWEALEGGAQDNLSMVSLSLTLGF